VLKIVPDEDFEVVVEWGDDEDDNRVLSAVTEDSDSRINILPERRAQGGGL
jgi:hypothetical protein